MELNKVNIESLNSAKYNPRKDLKSTDPEYIKLKNSVEHFGYVDPVIVNKRNMTVVGGHQRLKVLKDLGYKDIDVVYVDLNDTDEKALNIALNKISGDWDADKLEDLLRDLYLSPNFDVELTGFNNEEIDKLFGYTNNEDNKNEDDNDFENIDDFDIVDVEIVTFNINSKNNNKTYLTSIKANKDIIDSIMNTYNKKVLNREEMNNIISMLAEVEEEA